jgi:hypothetical protein
MVSFSISYPDLNKTFLTLWTSFKRGGIRGGERRSKERVKEAGSKQDETQFITQK